MTKPSKTKNDSLIVELSDGDILEETIEKLERRGFEPIMICFRDDSGEIEVLTRGGIQLVDFVNWLAAVWIPSSYERTRAHRDGH